MFIEQLYKTKNPVFYSVKHGVLITRPTGLEPVTYGLEIRCSIRLSYERVAICFTKVPAIYGG